MQMFKRLLWVVLLIVFVSGCAKSPVESLESVRDIVAHAYAAGATQFAPGEFQLASSALRAAELQVESGDFRRADRTLELARRYAGESLSLTIERKKQRAAEQKEIAEEKRLVEIARERELKRQSDLKDQREREKRLAEIEENKKAEKAKDVPKSLPAVVAPVLLNHIEVRVGDDLAIIAARPEVYDDMLLWPLIYKANRDQIKDPKEIFSGQILVIPRDRSRDESEAARQEARELELF